MKKFLLLLFFSPSLFCSEPLQKKQKACTPPGGLAIPQDDKSHIEKIDAVKKQLKKLFGDHNWEQRKAIIKKAVEDGIHPDALGTDHDNPLYQAVLRTTGRTT